MTTPTKRGRPQKHTVLEKWQEEMKAIIKMLVYENKLLRERVERLEKRK